MKSWYSIYSQRMCESYRKHVSIRYKPFINEIVDRVRKCVPVGGLVAEMGCGAGNISLLVDQKLNDHNVCHFLVDICPKMLSLAMENMKGLPTIYSNHDMIQKPNEHMPLPDFIHSHGVLEHFSDGEIYRCLQHYAHIPQVHFVPGNKYKTPSRGDERLLSAEEWLKIYPFDTIISFNKGYDLMLILI